MLTVVLLVNLFRSLLPESAGKIKRFGLIFFFLYIIYNNKQQLSSEIEVNSGRQCTDMRSTEVNIPKTIIHRD